MNTKTIKSVQLGVAIVIAGVLLLWWKGGLWWREEQTVSPTVSQEEQAEQPAIAEAAVVPVVTLPEPAALPPSVSLPKVPFTVQAPFAEWADPIFQDACEEASLVMAEAWVTKKTLTKEGAKERIEALAKYQKKTLGHSVDTSLGDTEKLLREFLKVPTAEVKRGVSIQDMKEALAAQKLVIVPTDGRKLGNPNFKQPGPPRHMLVVVGYDDATKEFIVNDPGTRKGEGYRYDQAVLYEAILDYPTGQHAEAKSLDKVMLVVRRAE